MLKEVEIKPIMHKGQIIFILLLLVAVVVTFTGCQKPPRAPLNLTASAVTETEVELHWIDNSDNEDGFKIYRDGSFIKSVDVNTNTFKDAGLQPATEYQYMVKAYNQAGESGYYICIITTPPAPPTPPPPLSVTNLCWEWQPSPRNIIQGGHWTYFPANGAYIETGNTLTLSWSSDYSLDGFILTECQYKNIKPTGISAYLANGSGSNKTISIEVLNSDRYYAIVRNPRIPTEFAKLYEATLCKE